MSIEEKHTLELSWHNFLDIRENNHMTNSPHKLLIIASAACMFVYFQLCRSIYRNKTVVCVQTWEKWVILICCHYISYNFVFSFTWLPKHCFTFFQLLVIVFNTFMLMLYIYLPWCVLVYFPSTLISGQTRSELANKIGLEMCLEVRE